MIKATKHLAAVVALATGLPAGHAAADLGEAATNPVSNLVQFRLQNQYTIESHNDGDWANAMLVQTVAPLNFIADRFDSLKGWVNRTTIPYVSTPNIQGVGRKHGMGDTNMLNFAVPKAAPKNTVWGIGASLNIPTAGDDEFTGSGSWHLGPAAVVMVTPMKGLQVGALVFHEWDVYDIRSNAPDVSKTFIQPILTKHFDKGWYVSLPDTPQSYDWEEEDWTLNMGAVLGRVFPVKGQPMQIFGGLYYNNQENGGPTAEWTFKLQFGWLFPQ